MISISMKFVQWPISHHIIGFSNGLVLNRWQAINSSPPVPHASVNWVGIGSGNGFLPVWCQAIIWTNATILSTGP